MGGGGLEFRVTRGSEADRIQDRIEVQPHGCWRIEDIQHRRLGPVLRNAGPASGGQYYEAVFKSDSGPDQTVRIQAVADAAPGLSWEAPGDGPSAYKVEIRLRSHWKSSLVTEFYLVLGSPAAPARDEQGPSWGGLPASPRAAAETSDARPLSSGEGIGPTILSRLIDLRGDLLKLDQRTEQGFNHLAKVATWLDKRLNDLGERVTDGGERDVRRQVQVHDEAQRRLQAERSLEVTKQAYADLERRFKETQSAAAEVRSELDRSHAELSRLQSGAPDTVAEPLERLLDLLRVRSGTGPAEDSISSAEVGAVIDALQRIEERLDLGSPAQDQVHETVAQLEALGDDPIASAVAAAKRGDIGDALDSAIAFVQRAPESIEARSRVYQAARIRELVRNLWQSLGDSRRFEDHVPWIEQALGALGMSLLMPDIGKTLSHRFQDPVERLPAAEGVARNSIVEIRAPGFTDRNGGVIEKAQVAIARD